MSEAQASSVVTSENLAEFHAQKLGLATETTEVLAEDTIPIGEVAAEQTDDVGESEPIEADKEATEPGERKQNPKLEKRFSELTKKRAEAEAKAAEAERKAVELEQRLKALEEGRTTQSQPANNEKPTPEQFVDAFEYAEALADWSAEQAVLRSKQEEANRKAEAERKQVLDTWSKRLESVKTEFPDYEDMVASSTVQISDPVRDAILESEVGPRILYELASNDELAEKITKMSPITALREIGKLEARFEEQSKESAPKTVKTASEKSKAPAPINPLKATSGALNTKIGSDGQFHGTYAQWKEARRSGKIR